jgi:hypothetical protein
MVEFESDNPDFLAFLRERDEMPDSEPERIPKLVKNSYSKFVSVIETN